MDVERVLLVSSEETVRRKELSVVLVVAVVGVGPSSISIETAAAAAASLDPPPPPKSKSHRLSCSPVRIGNLPLDLMDRLNDRPGDRRGAGARACAGIAGVEGVWTALGREGPAAGVPVDMEIR